MNGELERQSGVIYQNVPAIFDFTVKDKAKAAVGIDQARLVLTVDEDDLGTTTWDKPITTGATADGQVTNGAGGVGVFFGTAAEVAALTRTSKKGTYFLQVIARKTSDSKDVVVAEADITVKPGKAT